jgi:uncharacterized Zn-binding protein involved in type VI secretion
MAVSMLPGIWTGDTTTHGGILAEGEPTYTYGNKASAVVLGHKFWCPKCLCWSIFVEGQSNYTIDGRARVLQGHKASCGAKAIHTQGFNYHIEGNTQGSVGSQRNDQEKRHSEINRNHQQNGEYYHSFHLTNVSNDPVGYIVFSEDKLLDSGQVVGKGNFLDLTKSQICTDKDQVLKIAVQAPRLKI